MSEAIELLIGNDAPDFTLPASDGTTVSLSTYRSKKIVYLFFIREYN